MDQNVKVGEACIIQNGIIFGNGVTIRDHCIIYRDVEIGNRCDIGPMVHIERGVKIGDDCKIKSLSFICEGVTIGNRVGIWHNVTFCNEKHPKAVRKEKWQLKEEDRIYIEDDVNIGSGAIILPGVRIGARAMVGAGAVITKSVPPDDIVVGIPAVSIDILHGNWGHFLEG